LAVPEVVGTVRGGGAVSGTQSRRKRWDCEQGLREAALSERWKKGNLMSAPDTKLEKQARRHGPPLWGMAIGVLLATVSFLLILGWMTEDETPSGGNTLQTGGTAEVEAPSAPAGN
jgi:hypothetical protein